MRAVGSWTPADLKQVDQAIDVLTTQLDQLQAARYRLNVPMDFKHPKPKGFPPAAQMENFKKSCQQLGLDNLMDRLIPGVARHAIQQEMLNVLTCPTECRLLDGFA